MTDIISTSKQTISQIFKNRFIIPDYQRPYSWGKDERETLWADLYNFAFGNEKFVDEKDQYFLGTIVTFKNNVSNQNEVIDGQQRLITLLLLLRAFYEAFGDKNNNVCNKIAECIWKFNPDYTLDKNHLKIKSEVATDEDTDEFNKIISTGAATKGNKSKYAENFRYFQKKISELGQDQFLIFPNRILEHCIFMPIETYNFDMALRIFTTLNDRGMPLSDSDIFKSQFYKFFKSRGEDSKERFVRNWKNLETYCNKIFNPRTGTPTDNLFMKYMYYLLAKEKTKNDTFPALRVYYEKDNYKILKSAQVFNDLIDLLKFWYDIFQLNEERFSQRILKRLYVLKYSPYNIWQNIVSIYFMGNKDAQNKLEDEKFYKFLNQITALMLMQAIVQPGVQSIRRPFRMEFPNILQGKELFFNDYKQDKKFLRTQFFNMKFSQTKPITRTMLVWWLFQNENQDIPPVDTNLEIEHIYAKKLTESNPLKNIENLELLGNKSLLEKRINVHASSLPFNNKKIYYTGKTNKKNAIPTFNLELLNLAKIKNDFTESDILERNEEIFSGFIKYLEENNLLR